MVTNKTKVMYCSFYQWCDGEKSTCENQPFNEFERYEVKSGTILFPIINVDGLSGNKTSYYFITS